MRIVEGASLFNIDFASGIFSGIMNPDEGIWVFLNDNPPLPDNSKYSEFISRLGIPTISWAYCSDNIWRLKFIPTKEKNVNEICDELSKLRERFLLFFNNEGYEEIRKFEERFKLILDQAEQIKTKENSIELYRKILKLIFQRVLFKESIDVFLTGGFLEMNTTEHNDSSHLFKELYDQLKDRPSGEYEMVKGGKLIFDLNGNLIRANQIIKSEFSFELFNRNDRQNKIEIRFEDIIYSNLPKYNLKCEGTIQLLQLQSKGILCHLPWYMEGRIVENNYKCLEHITPISNSYSSRVSNYICEKNKDYIKNKTRNIRLNPSGYSLLDYDHQRIRRFISHLLQINQFEVSQLNDWKFLINNYPVSKEKLAEHQGQVSNFIDVKVKELTKNFIKSGCSDFERNLLTNEIKTNFLLSGEQLSSIIALLKFFRTRVSEENDTQLTKLQESFLQELSDGEHIKLNTLLSNLKSIVNYVGGKLIQFGFSKEDWKALNKRINLAIEDFEKTYSIPLNSPPTMETYKKNRAFGKLVMYSTEVLYEYYRFVSFFCSTVLKANIFTSFLIFGEEDYVDLIKEILNRREVKSFKYVPIYFKEGKNNSI